MSWRVHLVVCVALLGCTTEVSVFRPHDGGAPADSGMDAGDEPGDTPVLGAIAAFGHTCATGPEGLYCWGRSRDGQLGNVSDGTPPTEPLLLSGDPFTQVCSAELHSCVLGADGVVACWGANERGQLGLGDTEPRAEPVAIAGFAFRNIACGGHMTCGVARDGRVLCWGENAEGALGQGDAFGSPDSRVPSPIASDETFQQVSVGQGHACAVSESGALYCWGRNNDGQLGLGGGAVQVRMPSRVDGEARYRRVATGMMHSCAVRVDGSLYCWGSESDGALGLGAPESDRSSAPRQVAGSDYHDVHASWFHTCASHGVGKLSCWGRNLEGQLGIGDTMGRGREEPVELAGAGFEAFTTGQFHSCALRSGGVYCWGKNDGDLELGIGDVGRRDVPTRVRF